MCIALFVFYLDVMQHKTVTRILIVRNCLYAAASAYLTIRAVILPRFRILPLELSMWEVHPILGVLDIVLLCLELVLLLHIALIGLRYLSILQAHGLRRTKEQWHRDNQ